MLDSTKWTDVSLKRNVYTEAYEPIQPYIFTEFLREFNADVLLDIGANIGFYSLAAAEVPSVKQIRAYEPMPSTFRELQENVKLNELSKKITCCNIALSDSAGSIDFGVIGEYSGSNSIVDTSIHQPDTFKKVVSVQRTTLDSDVDIKDKFVAIKIDVEGHEMNVLSGAARTLSQNNILMQIESYSDDVDIKAFLENFGLRFVFNIGPDMYFLKSDKTFSKDDLCNLLGRAFLPMIEDRKRTLSSSDQPINIKFGPEMSLQISGSLAQTARNLKKKAKSLF
ncbi:MAG TPA: FkbM family methyltransferase [Ancylobacter sp.]